MTHFDPSDAVLQICSRNRNNSVTKNDPEDPQRSSTKIRQDQRFRW